MFKLTYLKTGKSIEIDDACIYNNIDFNKLEKVGFSAKVFWGK